MTEGFFGTLKTELDEPLPMRSAARLALFEYLEVFCNRTHLHSTQGYKSPADYEQQHQAAQLKPRARANGGSSPPPWVAGTDTGLWEVPVCASTRCSRASRGRTARFAAPAILHPIIDSVLITWNDRPVVARDMRA